MMAQWFIVQAASASASREKTVVIRLRGELDVTVRTTLEELLALLPGTQPDRLVIDLAEVSFMDCGTAAVVFRAARQTLPHGRKPVIRSPRPPVSRLLQITSWDQQCVIATSPCRGKLNRSVNKHRK
jgi:anti-anti-sigma factor